MNQIPVEVLGKYWRKMLARESEADIFPVLLDLHKRQPLVMTYLQVADNDSLNEAERRMLYYLGTFAVEAMLGESPAMPEVTEDEWERARAVSLRMMEFLAAEDSPENFRSSVEEVIAAHHQAGLFCFVFELMKNDPECRRSIREENVWRIFTHLRVVIDCLDKAGGLTARADV